MKTPFKCLDLFCGGGGAAEGLKQAGFFVFGIDNNKNHRKNYPGIFFHLSLEELIRGWNYKYNGLFGEIDFVWASPPCQAFSVARRVDSKTKPVNLILRTRQAISLIQPKYFCIENVPPAPIRKNLVLSMPMFHYECRLVRKRIFELNFPILQQKVIHRFQCEEKDKIVVSKKMGSKNMRAARKKHGLPPRPSKKEVLEAMGLSYNRTWFEIGEAVPPIYAKYIGNRVKDLLISDKKNLLNLPAEGAD